MGFCLNHACLRQAFIILFYFMQVLKAIRLDQTTYTGCGASMFAQRACRGYSLGSAMLSSFGKSIGSLIKAFMRICYHGVNWTSATIKYASACNTPQGGLGYSNKIRILCVVWYMSDLLCNECQHIRPNIIHNVESTCERIHKHDFL